MGTLVCFTGGSMDGHVVRVDSPNEIERRQAEDCLAITQGGRSGHTFWMPLEAGPNEVWAAADSEARGAGYLYAVVQRFVGEDGLLSVRLEYIGPTG